jgi:hypothetical protein
MLPFAGEAVPDFVGQWQGVSQMSGCHAYGPICTRASQTAHFFPSSVRLRLVQAGINLSGSISVESSPDETPVLGAVTADGGFVIMGSRQVYDSRVHLTAKFTPLNAQQLEGDIITETRYGERLALTFRSRARLMLQE